MRARIALLAVISAACANSSAPGAGADTSGGGVDGGPGSPSTDGGDGGANGTGAADGGARDASATDASVDASGPPPSVLPVGFVRPDVGTPLTPAEIAAATDDVIALLKRTRYFDVVDERVHGWPESEPTGYWYGTWWSGVTVTKQAGNVTFLHGAGGADNNGLRTAPYLEGKGELRVEPHEEIDRGGCVAVTDFTEIDASISGQCNVLRETFTAARGERE